MPLSPFHSIQSYWYISFDYWFACSRQVRFPCMRWCSAVTPLQPASKFLLFIIWFLLFIFSLLICRVGFSFFWAWYIEIIHNYYLLIIVRLSRSHRYHWSDIFDFPLLSLFDIFFSLKVAQVRFLFHVISLHIIIMAQVGGIACIYIWLPVILSGEKELIIFYFFSQEFVGSAACASSEGQRNRQPNASIIIWFDDWLIIDDIHIITSSFPSDWADWSIAR